MNPKEDNIALRQFAEEKYKYGFTTDVATDIIERGLNEDVVRLISAKKGEPDWLLDFRLKAFRHWLTMTCPTWAHLTIPDIDFQAISYYADPRRKTDSPRSLDDIDPAVMKTFDKLGIPLEERLALSGGMAVDAVMDSVLSRAAVFTASCASFATRTSMLSTSPRTSKSSSSVPSVPPRSPASSWIRRTTRWRSI